MRQVLGGAIDVVARNGAWMAWNTFLALIPLAIAVWLFRRGSRRFWVTMVVLGGVCLLFAAPFLVVLAPVVVDRVGLPYLAVGLLVALGALVADRTVFKSTPARSPLWWGGFALFILFLPNAPYVLTDVIHLVDDIRFGGFSRMFIVGVLVPLYAVFMFVGFEAYVLSLLSMRWFMRRRGLVRWVLVAEIALHLFCAVGIYVGRFLRFNSWDVVVAPYDLAEDLFARYLDAHAVVVTGATFLIIAVLYSVLKFVHLGLLALRTRDDAVGAPASWRRAADSRS